MSNNANKHGLNLTYKIASCLFPVLKKKKKKGLADITSPFSFSFQKYIILSPKSLISHARLINRMQFVTYVDKLHLVKTRPRRTTPRVRDT